MIYAFSPEGVACLAAVLATDPLLAFDIDGTLAPIVERPDEARLPDDVQRCLAELAREFTVAIITGRCNPVRYRRIRRGTGTGRSGIDGIVNVAKFVKSFVFRATQSADSCHRINPARSNRHRALPMRRSLPPTRTRISAGW